MEWAAASFQPRGSQCWIFDRGTLPFYLHTLTCVFSGEEIEKSASPQKPINTCCLVVNSCIEAQKKREKKKSYSLYVCHSTYYIAFHLIKMCSINVYFHPRIMYCTNNSAVALANCSVLWQNLNTGTNKQTGIGQIKLKCTHIYVLKYYSNNSAC